MPSTQALALSRLFFFLSSLVAAVACGDSCCDNDPVNTIVDAGAQCSDDRTCADDRDAYRFGTCRRSGCETDGDCCPGTRCIVELNSCVSYAVDERNSCNVDADCDDPAQRCKDVEASGRNVRVCVYDRCDGDDDCGEGRACYHSVCVASTPCGGTCPEGTACDVISSTCAPFPADSTGCEQACGDQGLLVFSDPDNMSGDTCCGLTCSCLALAPILPARIGRYSSIALTPTDAMVSAYDADFGDLVVVRYGLDGQQRGVDYVDGIPVGAPVRANASGPRGGITEPGPNVGTHTSIATTAQGLARIAYYDEDNHALKIAVQGNTGYTTHAVDSSTADAFVGRFTSIAVDAATSLITISYHAHNVLGAPGVAGRATGLKVARSKVAVPTNASDWDIRFVDARPMFDACGGTCSANQACVLNDGAATCLPLATCADGCSESKTCVADPTDGPVCAPSPLPAEDVSVPRGRGLFSSLILDGADTWVAYYDAIDGDARVAKVTLTANSAEIRPFILDGDGTPNHSSGDVGRAPALAKLGNELLVVYEDSTRHRLRAWQGTQPGIDGNYTTVDEGIPVDSPGLRFVGGNASISISNGSIPVVVYQDASQNDLKIARREGPLWRSENFLSEGANGFYADVALLQNQAFIVSVLARLDSRGRENSRVGLTIRNLP